MKRRTAVFHIAIELFLQALHLPEDTEVVDIWGEPLASNKSNTIGICVKHRDLKEVELGGYSEADPQFTRHNGEVLFVGWGQK